MQEMSKFPDISGSVTTAKETVTVIGIRMEALQCAIEELDKATHILGERLVKVLGPDNTLNEKEAIPPMSIVCQLARDLEQKTVHVLRIEDYIKSLIERLEI